MSVKLKDFKPSILKDLILTDEYNLKRLNFLKSQKIKNKNRKTL